MAADCDKPMKLEKNFGWYALLSYSALGEHALSLSPLQRPKGAYRMTYIAKLVKYGILKY